MPETTEGTPDEALAAAVAAAIAARDEQLPEDEPIVLDNPALKLDLHKKATEAGGVVTRWFSQFETMIVSVKKGGTTTLTLIRLHPEAMLTFALKHNGTSRDGKIEMIRTPNGSNPESFLSASIDLDGARGFETDDGGTGRRWKGKNDNFRINGVSGKGAVGGGTDVDTEFSLTFGRSDKVRISLLPHPKQP